VSHTFTKRNHYNPCFWMALWCRGYFEKWQQDHLGSEIPRDQVVQSLNLISGKVYPTRVDACHFDKDLGVATITADSIRRFTKKWHPDKVKEIDDYLQKNPDDLLMDFEDTLTFVENSGTYNALMEIAKEGELRSYTQKGMLACSLVIHAMRSHELMTAMTESPSSNLGLDKWEYFWILKNAWGDRYMLARSVTPLALGRWTLYRTAEMTFPLPDSPIMIGHSSLMAVLSPRLLLEIDLNWKYKEHLAFVVDGIPSSKYREFRRRAIGNTYKEMIHPDPDVLERIRGLSDFRRQTALLSSKTTRLKLIEEAASRVIWAIMGFGRVPVGFEQIVRTYLDP